LGILKNQAASDSRVGLQAPTIATMGNLVTGTETDKLRLQKLMAAPFSARPASVNVNVDNSHRSNNPAHHA
jgi:hypothetical protein